MKTLEDLLYYCNEPEPVGAILLTGEWGCGKTYLIEHDLKETLSEKSILHDKYTSENKTFAALHTNQFIKILDELLERKE